MRSKKNILAFVFAVPCIGFATALYALNLSVIFSDGNTFSCPLDSLNTDGNSGALICALPSSTAVNEIGGSDPGPVDPDPVDPDPVDPDPVDPGPVDPSSLTWVDHNGDPVDQSRVKSGDIEATTFYSPDAINPSYVLADPQNRFSFYPGCIDQNRNPPNYLIDSRANCQFQETSATGTSLREGRIFIERLVLGPKAGRRVEVIFPNTSVGMQLQWWGSSNVGTTFNQALSTCRGFLDGSAKSLDLLSDCELENYTQAGSFFFLYAQPLYHGELRSGGRFETTSWTRCSALDSCVW